jgi:hypothetical protein
MTRASVEQRVAALESELERLKQAVQADPRPWWQQIYGMFKDDPAYEEAMKLGRAYRESLRPKAKTATNKRRKKTNGRP